MTAWDSYAERLASLADWTPRVPAAEALADAARKDPRALAVVGESLELVRGVWRVLPADVRDEAMGVIDGAIDSLSQSAGAVMPAAQAAAEVMPAIKLFVAGVQRIAGAAKGLDRLKRDGSNYAHGAAQFQSIAPVLEPDRGFYTVIECMEFAQFVKVRVGGDFDRKPCFSRRGGARDAIFTGAPSPADDPGNCKKEMRRSGNDSYGPFDPTKCGRRLGVSAMLWPWWSAAYDPKPLPRWDSQYEGPGGFDAGPSPDTNARLVDVQTRLVMDPEFNIQTRLDSVTGPAGIFSSWWEAQGATMHPVRDGRIVAGATYRIDPTEDKAHVPSTSAPSRWYVAPDGRIQPYPGQADASLDAWGAKLPAGDPSNLACTIGQHNAVLDAVSAFAARRLATLRQPRLCEALLQDLGNMIDPAGRAAMAAAGKRTANVLPYPGASTPKKALLRGPLPRLTPKGRGGIPAPVVAGGAAGLLWLLSRLWKRK